MAELQPMISLRVSDQRRRNVEAVPEKAARHSRLGDEVDRNCRSDVYRLVFQAKDLCCMPWRVKCSKTAQSSGRVRLRAGRFGARQIKTTAKEYRKAMNDRTISAHECP